jgi:hypothetical protein
MTGLMRMLLAVLVVAGSSCAPAKYFYNFDVTDPGAKNLTKPGERDVIEDPDLRAELLVDPTSFQAILLMITNTTAEPMVVHWHRISVIGPDRVSRPLQPDVRVGRIEPYTKVRARLIPFELPDVGSAAASFDNQPFELVVPLEVRGQPRDFRIHLLAHAVKL